MEHKEEFEQFCLEKFVRNDSKGLGSKTISREKGDKIIKVLKKDPSAEEYSPKFKHWVKTRKFHLVTFSVLGLNDVLCLPAKSEVNK